MSASENLRQSAAASHRGGNEADRRVNAVQRLDATAEIMMNAITALVDRDKGGGAEVSITENAAQAADSAEAAGSDLGAAAVGAEKFIPKIVPDLRELAARSDQVKDRNREAQGAVDRAEEALLAIMGLLETIRTEHLQNAGQAYGEASGKLHGAGDTANNIIDGGAHFYSRDDERDDS